MTLDTRVYVLDPIDRTAVFRKCQEIIAQWDERRRTPEQHRTEDTDWGDHRVLMNESFQNLPGWLILHYRPGGPYRTEAQAAEHDHCDDDCDGSTHAPACWMEVSIDTAYGYRGPDGMNCGSLHARFVAELGAWLDEQRPSWCDIHDALEGTCNVDGPKGTGVPCAASPTRNPREGVRWKWLNEYTGEVHEGYDQLVSLVGSSDQAVAWFNNEVKPAIGRMVGKDA